MFGLYLSGPGKVILALSLLDSFIKGFFDDEIEYLGVSFPNKSFDL